MSTQIEIKYLKDSQEHISILAQLLYQEIGRHWVPDASVEKATDRLMAHLSTDKLPIAMIALHNEKPVGMACLRETDGIRPGVTPWLGSLVVNPEYRGVKIGESLIEAIKSQARLIGYETLYLFAFDPTIPGWYAKLGWQTIGYDEFLGHRVTVMSIGI